jgi:hypothetical protein
MASAGKKLDDEDLVSYILAGLDSDFCSTISVVTTCVESISVPDLYGELLAYEQRQEHRGKEYSSANAASRGSDVTTSDEPPTKEDSHVISKPRTVLVKGGEDIIMTISALTTIGMNSINPIQIQFGTLGFRVKIEDDENNKVPVAPCQIKIEGRNFIKGDDGHIMTKPRTALLQGGEDDEPIAPQNISASNQMQRTRKYYKEYDKLGCDLMDMWRRPASIGRGLQTCPNC